MNKNNKFNKGAVTVLMLTVIFLFSLIMFPIIDFAVIQSKAIRNNSYKEQSLQIAEAGINYYQWHLAHFPSDYKDGTATNGPYIHNYLDYNTEEVIGKYSLNITAPLAGSTIVTIASTGWTNAQPDVKKTIIVKYGIPSLAIYSFLSNDLIWVGSGSTINGQMHSNNGIRFDGVGNAPITSVKSTYTCGTAQGCSPSATKNGVWGDASQAVKNFWQFPEPAVDFSAVTANIAQSKSDAQSAGIYLPPSNVGGYSLVFNSNGTVSIYKVTSLTNTPSGAKDVNGATHDEDIDYGNRTLQSTQAIPSNGAIYIEDNVWVEGTVRGRIMVTVAKLPYVASSAPVIYIPNNIVYNTKDGTDVLGLLAQKDLIITYNAPNNLEIDAAIIAQYGSTQFFDYTSASGNTSKKVKTSLSIYGSIMAYTRGGFRWTSNGNTVSGFPTITYNYDNNLLYAPPPTFPISASGYKQISWTSN